MVRKEQNDGESDMNKIDKEDKRELSSFLKCIAHQSEEAWQREKVHGTEENLEWGIGEKNEEQIDAESGFEEED